MKTITELTPFELHEFILRPIAGRNFNDFQLQSVDYCLKHSTFEEYINDKYFFPIVDNFKNCRTISHPRVKVDVWSDRTFIQPYRASFSLLYNGNIEYDFKSESKSICINPSIEFYFNGDISIDGKPLSYSQTLNAIEILKKNNIQVYLK